jgi:hypothetical protein
VLDCRRQTATGRWTFFVQWHTSPETMAAAVRHHQTLEWETIDVWEIADEAPRDLREAPPQLELF